MNLRLILTCYKWTNERRNPCEDLRCGPGEQCVISENEQGYISAHCVCPVQCDNFGDSVESSPVCSNDGTDYPSLCHLRAHACKAKHNESVKYYGKYPCKDFVCSSGTVCKVTADRRAECRCSQQCTMHSDPVCATDGNTYENECLMSVSACRHDNEIQIYHKGRCKEDNPCKLIHCSDGETCHIQENGTATCRCIQYCPPVAKPVCSINGKTYDNECEMRRSACLSKIHNAVRHIGTCGFGVCAGYDGCRSSEVCVERNGQPVCECETCDSQLNEVCASDGITYANECKMRLESCLSGKFIYQKYSGICDGCVNVRCEFYAICVSDEAGTGSCQCPTQCADDNSGMICATDGITYPSECHMRLAACQQQKFIVVAFRGSCDSCLNIVCPEGQQCENGICSCPSSCPDASEKSIVCGTDGILYPSQCHLKMAICHKGFPVSIQPISNCPQPKLRKTGKFSTISGCDQQSCSFGGICVVLTGEHLSDVCLCDFNCATNGDDEAICASDGNIYNSTCFMDLASCQQQKPIYQMAPIHLCHYNDECGCNRIGSYNNSCDQRGQCRCLPGVGGQKCDHCMSGFWGLHLIAKGAMGCQPCGCSAFGSSRFDCEQSSGRCQCRPDSYGMKCDSCDPDSIITSNGCLKKAEFRTAKDCSELRCHHGAQCVMIASGMPVCKCAKHCALSHLGLVAEMSVCGSDGNTYDNICELWQFACLHQLDIVPSALGTCPQDVNSGEMQRRRERKLNATPVLGSLCADDADCRIFNTYCGEMDDLRLRSCKCKQGFFSSKDMTQCIQEKKSTEDSSWMLDGMSGIQVVIEKSLNRPFSVQLQAQALNSSGVLLYSSLNKMNDFILLLLSDSKLILSFSLRDEIFAIEWEEELEMNRSYKIRVIFLHNQITLVVDNLAPAIFKVPAKIVSYPLKLDAPIYLGYTPAKMLRSHPMQRTLNNFTGCLSNVFINGRRVFQERMKFVGTVGQLCEQNLCGRNELCGNKTSSSSIINEQRLNMKSNHMVPLFVGDGFLMNENLRVDVKERLEVEVWLKPMDSDGLVFYWAKLNTTTSQYAEGDFVALVLIASQPHFFWNLGSGIAYSRSTASLSKDRFHSIRFGRHLRNGSVQVDNERAATQISQPVCSHLDVDGGVAFIGGVPNNTILPTAVPELAVPLRGVVQRLTINGQIFFKLFKEFQQIGHVEEYDGPPCSHAKCGEDSCVAKLNEYICQCRNEYQSSDCVQLVEDTDTDPNNSIMFDGRHEYALVKKVPSKKQSKVLTDYQFMLKTNKSEGLIWWESKRHTIRSDYLAIFLLAGRIGFAINLGTDPKVKTIGSNTIVSDDRWHHVAFLREKRKCVLTVDSEKITYISSPGATEFTTDGIIWIGGKKKLPRNFPVQILYQGCLRNLRISLQLIDMRQEFSSNRTPRRCEN
uniref:Agrin n=1 Tax=Setaria digitata TaxID=48799 RepID=A0A915PPS5_9BILA